MLNFHGVTNVLMPESIADTPGRQLRIIARLISVGYHFWPPTADG